jgi:Uncharacterized conserved protein
VGDGPLATDHFLELSQFTLYIEGRSVSFLDDAEVHYDRDHFGGRFTFSAPSARVPAIGDDATLVDRVYYVLYDAIHPPLASHGGDVHLGGMT